MRFQQSSTIAYWSFPETQRLKLAQKSTQKYSGILGNLEQPTCYSICEWSYSHKHIPWNNAEHYRGWINDIQNSLDETQ